MLNFSVARFDQTVYQFHHTRNPRPALQRAAGFFIDKIPGRKEKREGAHARSPSSRQKKPSAKMRKKNREYQGR
jgi:hypothetical protein